MDLKEQYEKLLRYCCMKTKDRDLAEDIVQETFLKFWQSRSYQDTGKELAYLYVIARNLCMDAFRRQMPEDIDGHEELSAGAKSEPETAIVKMALDAALEQLPQEVREIIVLRYTNEMRVTDIAKITGMSRFAVHRKLKEGLALLKRALEGERR